MCVRTFPLRPALPVCSPPPAPHPGQRPRPSCPRSQHRDPRFASGPGGGPASTDPSFRRRYAFVYDDVLPREREELVAKIKVRLRAGDLCVTG